MDGRVRDAGVQDRFAVVRKARCSQVTFAFAVVVGVVSPSELGDLRRLNADASLLDEFLIQCQWSPDATVAAARRTRARIGDRARDPDAAG
eukprot:COSAG02_NODE_9469_length_2206_cov_3.149027_1_plen_90_part_10